MTNQIASSDIILYLQNKKNKETKARKEKNSINNNILKEITFQKTLTQLNSDHFQNCNFLYKTDKALFPKEKSSNDSNSKSNNKSSSEVLKLKKIKNEIKMKGIFKKKNTIKLEQIRKYLNIKKKKYNKGKDFCSFFIQPRQDYNLNALNKGMINSFISFYFKGEKYYSNSNIDESKISLKICDIEYPIFNFKRLNHNNNSSSFNISSNGNKNNEIKIYDKCCNILENEKTDSNSMNAKNQNCNYFIQGFNHNIRYDLENYLSNRMNLLGENNNYSVLFENKNFIKKYQFQFIKIVNNKKISIDEKNIIADKKLKYSFNEPRMMYPLFLNSIFDNINIFKHCSFFKKQNFENNNVNLNLIFSKNIDRFHELDNKEIGKEFQKSEESFNILNGSYLINPLQTSINNRQLIQNTKYTFKPKKLISKLEDILGDKNRIKFKQKRNYLSVVNNDAKNKKIIEKKLIIINAKNVGKLFNNTKEYLELDDIDEGFDFLFDISICGKIFLTNEFLDEFEYNGYNTLIDLINRYYLYYSKFYIFIINDQQLNKNGEISVNAIINKINQMINNKFSLLINNINFQFNVDIKVVSNPHLINYEINNIYDDLVSNYNNNLFSVYNKNIYNRILNDIKSNGERNKVNDKSSFNRYENYILDLIHDEKLKEELLNMIKNKYSKINII